MLEKRTTVLLIRIRLGREWKRAKDANRVWNSLGSFRPDGQLPFAGLCQGMDSASENYVQP